jgi:hypothetical protein
MKGIIVLILAMAVIVVVVGTWARPVFLFGPEPTPIVIYNISPPMCAGNPPLPDNCKP